MDRFGHITKEISNGDMKLSRRGFTAVGLGVLLGGCSSSDPPEATGEDDTETPVRRTVGDSVTYNGVKATITEVTTTDSSLRYEPSDETKNRTPSEGATWILYHLVVTNNSDNERWFPESDNLKLYYKGQDLGYGDAPSYPFMFDGRSVESFFDNIYDKDADSGVFPGVSISGWVAHEVPDKPDLGEAIVGLELGRTPDDDFPLKEFCWRLG